jgi:hypothetical protein
VSKRVQVAALLLIVALGFVLRVRGLNRVGLKEDEVHKVQAARAYLHGNFFLNLEHPMLMKSLIAVSLAATDSWNRGPGAPHPVPEEVAVRLPNAIFGALTPVVIFLLAREFFGPGVALLSALFWSTGTIAIMDNRIAKEDTLLVFFTWLAYYFYLRAKKAASAGTVQAEWYYAASGASFGLMLASKYFPHYLGLIFLFYGLLGDKEKYPPRRWRDSALLFGTCILLFFLFNPVVLDTSTLTYMLHYAGEGTMSHHGYLMMGHFYYNDPAHLRGGMPVYFYPLFLILKTPVPLVGALILGAVETWKRRREPGPLFLIIMFLSWIIPFSLVSAKWLRWMLSWMPSVYIIAALGAAKALAWAAARISFPMRAGTHRRRNLLRRWAPALATRLVLMFLAEPAWVSAKSAPYYTLYLNPLGLRRTAYYFPHDEMNDLGLREAIAQICEEAPEGASVGGETAPVFEYYFHRFGRDDLHYFDLSDQATRMEAPPASYLVIQDGRKYFENISFIQKVESYLVPIHTVEIGGAPAVRVYRDQYFAELRSGR